jgi:hypothetical protein
VATVNGIDAVRRKRSSACPSDGCPSQQRGMAALVPEVASRHSSTLARLRTGYGKHFLQREVDPDRGDVVAGRDK